MSDHEYIGQQKYSKTDEKRDVHTILPDVDNGQPKRKKINKKIIISVIALVLVVAVVAGVFSFYNTPVMKISKAFEKTLFDSSKISIDGELSNGMGLDGDIAFGEGIKGSTLDFSLISTRGKEVKFLIQDGIIYAEEKQVGDVFETLEKLKENPNDEDKLTIALIETLDKAINGKLDKEMIENFVKNELPSLIPNDSEKAAPDSETIEKAIKKIIKKSVKEDAINIESDSVKSGKKYDIRVNVKDVINCAFELSEKDENVDALIQYIVDTNEKYESKEDFKDSLDEMDTLKSVKFRFSVTIKPGRVTGIEIKDTIKLKIDSEK